MINVQKYYQWNIVESDPDDNKFVDCAVASGANYIVSEDTRFKILNQYPYFKVKLLILADFEKLIASIT